MNVDLTDMEKIMDFANNYQYACHMMAHKNDHDEYKSFLARKAPTNQAIGLKIEADRLSSCMFDFQRDVTAFCLQQGRSGLFLDTGLGKTLCQLEFAERARQKVKGRMALILTPLAVARQIEREAMRFDYGPVKVIRDQSQAIQGINICNYDRLDKLDPDAFGVICLDESSILKSFGGKTSQALIETFRTHRFKLAATATPAPNDHMELGTHSEFLNVMASNEMLSRFFINDTSQASQQWRLKGHAESAFWDWMASWSRMAQTPDDLGYDGSRFRLPELHIIKHETRGDVRPAAGSLFVEELSATTIQAVKRQTAKARAEEIAKIIDVSNKTEPWLVWCDTDAEADALLACIPNAAEVRGSHPVETKEDRIAAFVSGEARILISKPSICGYGLNFQHCARMAFVGRSFSYESWYQAVRRCWRFGQSRPVEAHVIVAEGEAQIGRVIDRKASDHDKMKRAMSQAMRRAMGRSSAVKTAYEPRHIARPTMIDAKVRCLDVAEGRDFTAFHGDCVDVMKQLPDASIDFSIYSPPFGSLFVYSESAADMGNSTDEEFSEHYAFMVREKLRLTKPGRITAVHCSDLPMTKWREGAVGIKDFSGDIIRIHQDAGWIMHSRRTIWKSPVIEMTRTKHVGLLYKQLQSDSIKSRGGMPDYLLTFVKPGENQDPIVHTPDGFPLSQWQEWASPVWMTVNQTNVLNVKASKDHHDERHICPLQLDVIERGCIMWSNPGDLVLSPFMGIGSEGVVALKQGRRFIGVELKGSYWKQAAGYLSAASEQMDLFAERPAACI